MKPFQAPKKASVGRRAWLLNFGSGFVGAVAFHEMSQILVKPTLFNIPCTPIYCHQLIMVRGRLLPIMNMVTLLTGEYQPQVEENGIIGIAVYQQAPHDPLSYVGLHLNAFPNNILVNDKQFSELPESSPHWSLFSLSCFAYAGRKVPVIDLAALFSAPVRQALQYSKT